MGVAFGHQKPAPAPSTKSLTPRPGSSQSTSGFQKGIQIQNRESFYPIVQISQEGWSV